MQNIEATAFPAADELILWPMLCKVADLCKVTCIPSSHHVAPGQQLAYLLLLLLALPMADPAQANQTLDEDDDFVEFETDNWTEREANYNQPGLFESTWDDLGDGNDAVAQQIRTELTKKQQAKQGS